MDLHRIVHPIAPVYDENSKILILGSFPSVKSREFGFFYGHAQNRFWKVLAFICKEPVPQSITEKKGLLLGHGIALYDVIASCDIIGSADSSIKNPQPADLSAILEQAPIRAVFTNGKKAHELYQTFQLPLILTQDVCLPSTSPANAVWTLEKLQEVWGAALGKYI